MREVIKLAGDDIVEVSKTVPNIKDLSVYSCLKEI